MERSKDREIKNHLLGLNMWWNLNILREISGKGK
jgi:hypothetical protein